MSLLLGGKAWVAASTRQNHHHHKHSVRINNAANRTRLQCLQKGFGDPSGPRTGHWELGHMDADDTANDETQWMYQDSECSFMPFDNKQFCQM
jgi:hypothetical protein